MYGISAGHIYCPLEPPQNQVPKVAQANPVPADRTTKKKKVSKKERFFPERAWDPNNLPIYTDSTLRSNQKTVENKMGFVWGKLVGTNGEPVFSRLNSIIYPWSFTPDVMHLVDENTLRLYLAHWMGVFEQKQNATAEGSDAAAADYAGTKGRKNKKGNKNKSTKSRWKRKGKAKKDKRQLKKAPASSVAPGIAPEAVEKPFGAEGYILPTKTRELIGREIASSRRFIPTAFGKAIRDINKYHASYKASELLNFMHLVSPNILNRRLPEAEYSHWHHLVLSTEKARQYKLSIEDIREMGEDMVKAVTEYECLYYRYKRGRLSSCTSQVHGLLHISTAIRVCGPSPIYHQYPMERMCGFIKSMNHSRSSQNRSLSLGILEAERLKFLPYIAKTPKVFKPANPQHEELQLAASGVKLFNLSPKDKHEFPDSYPEYLLMLPKVSFPDSYISRILLMLFTVSKILNQYERAHLRKFCSNITGNREYPPAAAAMKFRVWGRAVSGRVFSNESAYEITGSLLSNVGRGAIDHTKRNDSHIRYTISDDSNQDISYFGRVLFYLPYTLQSDDGETELLLAYVQRMDVGRVRKRKLVYKIKDGVKEFIDPMDVQELLGSIESRGKRFFVSKTSCFWPKKGFAYAENIENEDLFSEDDE